MPRHTLEPVTLIHSHAVKGRKDYVNDVYSGKAFDRKVKDGNVLDKSIHSYRMWFNFLKLALELEEQNAVLITRNSVKRESTEKGVGGMVDTGRVTHKVRVDRTKYRDWDLYEITNLSFDDWWKDHEHLFVDQVGKVLKPHDVVSSNPDVFTYEIDKRRRLSDVIKDLRSHYEENKIERVSREKYPIEGKVRPIVLQNRFNALVLKLEDNLSNEEILTHKDNYIRATDTRTAKGKFQGEYGRVIFELIGGSQKNWGAKQILLSVCDGYFVKHPTKTYL
tara:strand:- start:766 stop:1599 length:834 start_codon:yes stop_codon:yes gene_type:complete